MALQSDESTADSNTTYRGRNAINAESRAPSSKEKQIGYGLFGGAVGVAAVGLVGIGIAVSSGGGSEWGDFDGLGMFLGGLLLGEIVGVPVGVHAGSRPGGNLALSLLASAAVAGAAVAAGVWADQPFVYYTVPLLQIGACIAVEDHSGRRTSPSAP